MTTPPDQTSTEPLNYAQPSQPSKKLGSLGCLIASVLFVVPLGLLYAVLIFLSATNGGMGMALLLSGIVIISIGGAFIAKKFGASAALAMAIAGLCAFGLLWGLCSSMMHAL